jgi:hypothetical protein
MNRLALLLGLGLLLAGRSPAQVTVQVVLEQDQFLRNGSLPVKVRVVNSSGQTLHLGREPGWLLFEIRDTEGRDVRQLDKVPLADAFDLPASKVANLSIDLMPYFELGRAGKYSVAALLKVEQLGQVFTSSPKPFYLINGTKLWEREFGVPAAGVPEVRKYALQQANSLKELQLYLRVTDPGEGKVFRVVSLGPLVSFSKPETQLDKSSNLHVLFQTTARNFRYLVLTPDGETVIRQTFEYYNGSRPVLRHDDDLGVRVLGGRRRVTLSDLPPPPDEPPPAEVAPDPSSTNAPPKAPSSTNTPAKRLEKPKQ